MSHPLVSIVVPVYNAQELCRNCFDSLVAINYPNKEIILVDDHSIDCSRVICDEYAEQYSNIKVIHQPDNLGVTQARITGVKHAQGEYVMFVDSDDYVHPDILSIMTDSMLVNEADMVCCQTNKVDGQSVQTEKRSILGVHGRKSINELLATNLLYDNTLQKSGMPLYLWGKLYKRKYLNDSLQIGKGITFEEDLITVLYMLVNKIDRMVILDKPLYYYVHHKSQITSCKLWKLWPSYIKVWENIDKMGFIGWEEQLSKRIWMTLKPSIYDNRTDWGGIFNNNYYIECYRSLRKSHIVKKYIWNKKTKPRIIKRHPHYILLKLKLFYLDYFLYYVIWTIKK